MYRQIEKIIQGWHILLEHFGLSSYRMKKNYTQTVESLQEGI